MSRFELWVVLAMTCCVAGTLSGAEPTESYVKQVAPGVYFRKAQTAPNFTGCNQGWVVFKDFVLVIDANFPGQYDEVLKQVLETTDKPIRYVFDTHHHGDHADGNVRYVHAGATAVASERSRIMFDTKGQDGFLQAVQTRGDEYRGLTYEKPSLFFANKLVLDDGQQRVELLYFGHGHTIGDAVAWLPEHKILFSGDACVNGAFNYTGDSDTASWITVLNAMQELAPKAVCPGHGELSDGKLIETQKQYFVQLREAVQKGIDKGLSVDEIKMTLNLPFYKEWTGVDARERVENITHVYQELMGGK